MITENKRLQTSQELIQLHGSSHSKNINSCVKTLASRWTDADGTELDFREFCVKSYISDQSLKNHLFEKLQIKIEKMFSLAFEFDWSNKWSLMMDTGPLEPVDIILAEINPFGHLEEEFYRTKLAHLILLNFPILSLQEKSALTASKSDRMIWAQCRLAEQCRYRIPFEVRTKESSASNYSYQYINHLKFDLERILIGNGGRLMNAPLKVDTHWGLRDQIVELYQDKQGLEKQIVLSRIWERATIEEVPAEYYINSSTTWDPITNLIFKNNSKMPSESCSYYHGRYKAFHGLFEAKKSEDLYAASAPRRTGHESLDSSGSHHLNLRKCFESPV